MTSNVASDSSSAKTFSASTSVSNITKTSWSINGVSSAAICPFIGRVKSKATAGKALRKLQLMVSSFLG